MTEAEWLACVDPGRMLAFEGTRPNPRKRRLFVVACCRRIENLLTGSGKRAVAAAEGFADGTVGRSELHDAWRAVGFPKAENRRYASAAARAASVSPGNDLAGHGAACAVNAVVAKSPATRDVRADSERAAQADLLRDIFGNPFRPVSFDAAWRTEVAEALARRMYESREFGDMPILADALQDAGCEDAAVLAHCRDPQGIHVRGCWVVDVVLGRR